MVLCRGKLTVNAPVAVLVGLTDHLVNLVIGQLLADRRHDMTKLGRRNEAVVVTVKDLAINVRGLSKHQESGVRDGP